MSSPEVAARRGRPRLSSTDERILRAARELIHELGPQAVNVASVAERSGVARTTIYRRHDDRTSLLRAVLEPVARRGEPPADLDVAGRLEWLLEQTQAVVLDDIGPGGLAAVLTGSDPEFSDALRATLHSGLASVVRQVETDAATGELVPAARPEVVVNLVLGSCLAQLLLQGVPDAQWRSRTAAALADLLAGRARGHSGDGNPSV